MRCGIFAGPQGLFDAHTGGHCVYDAFEPREENQVSRTDHPSPNNTAFRWDTGCEDFGEHGKMRGEGAV